MIVVELAFTPDERRMATDGPAAARGGDAARQQATDPAAPRRDRRGHDETLLAHCERLAALRESGRLLAAGPLADCSGALLIFTTDEETLTGILADDPYYTTPGVTVVSRRSWNPVVGP